MTCPNCQRAVPDTTPAELRTMIDQTRAALDDPDRHPDHPVGALAIELREARDEVRRLRATIAEMTPRWREGEPPAEAQVWREYLGAKGPVVVYTFANHNDGRIMYYGFADDEPKEWGTARWCPINKPETP
jgi:hypothetical protein